MTKRNDFIVSVCALVVSISAAALSFYSIHSERQQKRVDAFIALEQFLHQPEISEARAAVRQSSNPADVTEPHVRRVLSSFDFAASLVREGAVDRDMFFHYWQVPLELFGKRLEPVRTQKIADQTTAEQYYKDAFWLIAESRICGRKAK